MAGFHSGGMTEKPSGQAVTELPPTARRAQHITIVSETFPPEVNDVANTMKHLCQRLVQRGQAVTVIRQVQRLDEKGMFGRSGDDLFDGWMIVTGRPLPD